MAITVTRVVEVNIEMTLNEQQASDLLYFVRHGLTPPRAPSIVPPTNIVQELGNALIQKGVK